MNRGETIERILFALDEFEGVRQGRWTQAQWTRSILTALCGVGQDLGYISCATGAKNADWGEWLFDACWLDGRQGLRSVPMVAECEWEHMGEIEADFHKLLVARASLRVMVCDGWCQPDVDDANGRATAERLRRHVREFQDSRIDDTYLLIIYEWHERKRRSWRYRMRVNARGMLPTLESLRVKPARPPARHR